MSLFVEPPARAPSLAIAAVRAPSGSCFALMLVSRAQVARAVGIHALAYLFFPLRNISRDLRVHPHAGDYGHVI
jgi:hypothetical protein